MKSLTELEKNAMQGKAVLDAFPEAHVPAGCDHYVITINGYDYTIEAVIDGNKLTGEFKFSGMNVLLSKEQVNRIVRILRSTDFTKKKSNDMLALRTTTGEKLAEKYIEVSRNQKKFTCGYHYYRVYRQTMKDISDLIDSLGETCTEDEALENLRMAIDTRTEKKEALNEAYLDAIEAGSEVFNTWYADAVNRVTLDALTEAYRQVMDALK